MNNISNRGTLSHALCPTALTQFSVGLTSTKQLLFVLPFLIVVDLAIPLPRLFYKAHVFIISTIPDLSRSFLQFLTLCLLRPYFLNPAYLFPLTKLPWHARLVIATIKHLSKTENLQNFQLDKLEEAICEGCLLRNQTQKLVSDNSW